MKTVHIFLFVFFLFIFATPRADAVTELRTVEYFINSTDAQMAASAWWNSTFDFKLSDTSAAVKNAFIEIYGSRQSGGTTDRSVDVYFNNTLLGTYTTESGQEGYLLHIVSNVTNAFYTADLSATKQWRLEFKNGATDLIGGLSAKLVVTYQYSGPPKTKTVRYYVNNSNGAIAASGWNNQTFPFQLNGTNPAVKSAFFETIFENMINVDFSPKVYLNNTQIGNPTIEGSSPSYGFFGMYNATATSPSQGIYAVTDTNLRNYQYAFQCGSGTGVTCEGHGAALVVTYESDAESPMETATFYVNSTAAQLASNGWSNQTFFIQLSDNNPVVKSAYLVVRGMIVDSAATITVKVYLNNTLLAAPAYVDVEETANFMIFANATSGGNGFYSINDNNLRSYQVSIQCASVICQALSTDLILTYQYDIPDTTFPQFSLNASNATSVAPGGGVLLYSNWTDETDLQWAMLETNETGSAANKTSGSYGPVQINLTNGNTWSNFTWSNSSVAGGTVVAWRIFGNDTAGNTNITGLATFRVYQTLSASATLDLTLNSQTQNTYNLLRAITNAISATLQMDKFSIAMRSANNGITGNIATQTLYSALRAVSQAVTGNPAVSTIYSFLRSASQALTTNTAAQALSIFLRTITNILTTNTAASPLSNFFRSASNSVTGSTAATTLYSLLRSASQAVTNNLATQTISTFVRTATNALSPNSLTQVARGFFTPISQAITQNAAVQTSYSLLRSASQAVTQNSLIQATSSIFRLISQQITQTTATSAASTIFKFVNQALTQNFATKTAYSIFRSASDAITGNAAAKTAYSLFRSVSEAVTQNAAAKTAYSLFRSVSEAVTQNAAAKSLGNFFRSLSEGINQNLSISRGGLFFKSVSQNFQASFNVKSSLFHTYYIIVSQSISQHMYAFFGTFRPPTAPTGPTVAVYYGGGGGFYTHENYPTITPMVVPAISLKPAPTVAIKFLKQPVLKEVTAGQPIVDSITIQNIGNVEIEELTPEVDGIPQEWITILPGSLDIDAGAIKRFSLFITPEKDAQQGDYQVNFKVKGGGIIDRTLFMLRVNPLVPAMKSVTAENVSVENVTTTIPTPAKTAEAAMPVLQRAVSIDTEQSRAEIVLNVRNGAERRENVVVTENIKKDIANSTDFIEFAVKPDEIIQKDPIVRWNIKELQPFEAKNLSYTVKDVLPDFAPYIYWPTEEITVGGPAPSNIVIHPLSPIELQPGRFVPTPITVENKGNVSSNISITIRLPERWSLIPPEINQTIGPTEAKIFKFFTQVPADEFPGYYIGKVYIYIDGQLVKKDYEFAVLSNLDLLVRPIVVVMFSFFLIGVVWIRLKVIELHGELEEIKRLTEVRKSEDEIVAEIEKTRKAMRDLDALYRDNVINEDSYRMEKSMLKSKLKKSENEAEKMRKASREEKPSSGRARKFKKEMERASKNLNELEEDYNKNKISRKFYLKERRNAEVRVARLQKELAGNRPLFEEIKTLVQNRKILIKGVQKLKFAYDEGFVDRSIYRSSYSELERKIRDIDSILRRKYGMLEREKEKMIGSSVLLKVASQLNV